uniref:Uncharacterized protein n=1 Tax=Heterorhabditis bacteriophora TaxID=37862 RepID=A0A1I7XMC9_HETBA
MREQTVRRSTRDYVTKGERRKHNKGDATQQLIRTHTNRKTLIHKNAPVTETTERVINGRGVAMLAFSHLANVPRGFERTPTDTSRLTKFNF